MKSGSALVLTTKGNELYEHAVLPARCCRRGAACESCVPIETTMSRDEMMKMIEVSMKAKAKAAKTKHERINC
jgi:hypothetical protein